MLFLRRWSWLILLILFSFTALYASGIDNGSSHDKLKYLSIAWSMFQRGDYLVPMVNGIHYTDKPPLIFWLIAGSWHLFGVNMFSLQCLIDGILISWCLMTRAIYATLFPGDQLGEDLTPYLLIGSYAVWRDAWFLRVDILLLAGILLCNLGILKVLANSAIKRAYVYIVAGVCIGLFSKGPIIYIFTLLPFLVSAIFIKDYRKVTLKIKGAALLGTLIFLGTWAIPAILYTDHAFAKDILYQQIAHRAAHSNKSYFVYLYQYIPMLFLPWIMNLIFYKKLVAAFQETKPYRFFIVSIFIVSIIVFSFFGQKSLWYILPILPFGLIFLARFFVENKNDPVVMRLNRIVLGMLFGFFGVLSMSLLLSSAVQARLFENFGGHFALSPIVMVSFSVMSFLVLGYIVYSKTNLLRLLSISSVMLFLIYNLSNLYFFPFEQQFTQINLVGNYLHKQELNTNGIVLYQSEYLGQFDYVGRLTQEISILNAQDELESWLKKNPKGIVMYSGNHCPDVKMHKIISYKERALLVPFLLCQRT